MAPRAASKPLFPLVAALALSAASATAHATVMIPLSIEDLAVKSAAVVRARVLSSEAAWDTQKQRIYTTTTLEVLDPIHAKSELPRQITIRTLGGEVGKIGMKVSGTEKFTLNEEVVVFVRRDPVVTTAFQVIGMSQGKYHVEREASGGVVAIPSVEGLAFVRPQGASGTLMVDPSTPPPSRIPLAQLRERVLAAVKAAAETPAQLPSTLGTPGVKLDPAVPAETPGSTTTPR
ncbi:hypothetical protein L6R52_20390 [Myxococcota bacterium]|nr:hypothetical protein [Myxococcota bacterium]